MKTVMIFAAALTCMMLVHLQGRAQSAPVAPAVKIAPAAQDAQQGARKATLAPQVKEPAAPAMSALQPSAQPAAATAAVPQKADDTQVQSVMVSESSSPGIKPVNIDRPKPSTVVATDKKPAPVVQVSAPKPAPARD